MKEISAGVVDDLRRAPRARPRSGLAASSRSCRPCRCPGLLVVRDDVGERAADVHRDAVTPHRQTLPPGARPRRRIASLRQTRLLTAVHRRCARASQGNRTRAWMRVVGVDIGGTFTGLHALRHGVRRRPRPQGSFDSGRSRSGPGRRARGICGQAGVEAADVAASSMARRWPRTPCSSTAGRSAGLRDYRGLPGRRAHRTPSAASALLDHAGHSLAGSPVRQAASPDGRS